MSRSVASWGRSLGSLVVLCAFVAGPLPAQAPPTPVRVRAVESEVVRERREVTGEVRSMRKATIAAEEAGLVLEFTVREGELVAVGDLLCRLDAKRLELERLEQEAEVLRARAVFTEREAEAAWRLRDLEVLQALDQRRAANKRELDDAESSLRVARAREEAAGRAVGVAEARAALLDDRIEDCHIRAPFAGEVTARLTEIGQWLDQGDGVLELLAVDELEVWLDVPQGFFGALSAEGASVEIRVDATSESFQVAEVRTVRAVDPRARTFAVIASLPKAARVAPGMSATAWVPTGTEAERLVVSRDAILRSEIGPYLYVAQGGGADAPASAMLVPIEILFSVGDRVVVASPRLAAGALAVVEGNERLYPMAPVIPMRTDAEAPEENGGADAPASR